MKILYYHQYFTTPKEGGGVRSYMFAKALMACGHEVTIVSGKKDIDLEVEERSKNYIRGTVDGIRVIQINVETDNKDGLLKRAKDFLKFGILGIKVALREEYDLLYATSTPLTAGIPGIYAKRFSRKKFKFVFEVRDLWPDLPKALGVKNPLILGGMRYLEKQSYRKSDACIGLSPGICEGIRKYAPKNHPITMIPNGSDIDLFVRDATNKAEIPGVNPEDVVAIFPGAHGIANGLDAVLDMAKALLEKNVKNIKIVMVGDGKMKPHLQQRASSEGISNCIFLDPVSKQELNRIMNRADIGLMVLKNVPAFYYGTSPNKFFDFLSASLPVVNNYPGWLTDLITEHQCGIAVSPNDAGAFAEALQTLANDKELREQMGKNSRRLAEDQFARPKLAEELVGFLEEQVI